ncbi:MAG: histidine phosphatase family protein [Chromatiales bacterium]|nr:histidine phosphatase family protein [Chromatiales bacterium]
MRILLVRHGETAGNRQRYIGHEDIPLNATGRRQADALAAALGSEPIVRVLASPLARARDTASPLAAPRGLEVEIRAGLMEIDYGRLQGQLKEGRGLRLRRHHVDDALPEGESLRDVWARLGPVAEELAAAAAADGAIAVVAHYWSNRMLRARLTGGSLEDALADRAYKPANASAYLLEPACDRATATWRAVGWLHRPPEPEALATTAD